MKSTVLVAAQSLAVTIVVAACLLSAQSASAQSVENSDWNTSVGAMVLATPQYPGSKNERAMLYPFGDVIYKDAFFFRSDSIPGASIRGLGAYLYKGDGFELTASIAPDFDKRDAADDYRFHNLSEISPTVRAALAASYQTQWFKISGAITRDLSEEKKEGVRGGIDATGIIRYSPDLTFSAGPGVSYGNAEYMKTFYGISTAQSQESGLPVYNANGGVSNVHVNVGVNYRLNASWNIGGFVSEARLAGDAENSPVVESKNQTTVGIYFKHQM